MLVATADAVCEHGVNYQQALDRTVIDVDVTAVHITYIQLSLLHYPAVMFHGDALTSANPWSHWDTLAHTAGAWDGKLRRGSEVGLLNAEASPMPMLIDLVADARETVIEQLIKAAQHPLF